MTVTALGAVLFDMDGVLVDSEYQWKQAEGGFFAELGLPWSESAHERFVGLGVFDLHQLLVREYGLEIPPNRFFELSHRIAESVYRHRVRLADGAADLLRGLRRRKIPTALVSSSPHLWIRMVLDRFCLESFFDAVVSADDVGGQGKPSPAIYLLAAERLGLEPPKCLAIEDSAHGVQAAKRAGMVCLAYRDGNNDRQDLSEADGLIRSFANLDPASLAREGNLSLP